MSDAFPYNYLNKKMDFGKFIPKYITKVEEIAADVLKNSWRWNEMKIWAKEVRTFNFHAHDVKESLRNNVLPYNICDFVKKIMQLIKDRGLER